MEERDSNNLTGLSEIMAGWTKSYVIPHQDLILGVGNTKCVGGTGAAQLVAL